MISVISTAWLRPAAAGHLSMVVLPSAIFTIVISSSMVTAPLRLQSPKQQASQAHPVSTVSRVQKPLGMLPSEHRVVHGRLSQATSHSPGAGVTGTHRHPSALGMQVPGRKRGAAMHERPSHTPPQSTLSRTVGVAVAVGVGVIARAGAIRPDKIKTIAAGADRTRQQTLAMMLSLQQLACTHC
jgi:hypothetical protein